MATVFLNAVVLANDFDSLVVQTKETHLKARVDRILNNQGFRNYKKINNKIFVVPLKDNVAAQVEELKNTRLFSIIELNYKLSLDKKNNIKINDYYLGASDRNLKNQYYLEAIKASDIFKTDSIKEVKIAVLDSGINASHPDLLGKVEGREGHEYEDLTDDIGHGTEVAGIIAANTNNKGIVGIAGNSKLLSIRVTDTSGLADVSTIVAALDAAYNNGAKIIQLSLSTAQQSKILENAIHEAQNKGLLIIAAGGNSGTNEPRYPAAFDGVIGVGAVDENNEVEEYSTQGEHIDITAPGTNIYTTSIGKNKYKFVTGTSFATPQVTGLASILWGIAPELSANEIENLILNGATDIDEEGLDNNSGYGLLNIANTLDLLSD